MAARYSILPLRGILQQRCKRFDAGWDQLMLLEQDDTYVLLCDRYAQHRDRTFMQIGHAAE